MVFNFSENLQLPVLLFLAVWLSILSALLYRVSSHYNHLTKGVVRGDLKTILEKILAKADLSEENIGELAKRCQKMEEEDRFHIKKIGVLRFNPFKDTGGNQSFVLALLNDDDSGLVLSSLYTRTGNRWYVKRVEKGKGVELELSKEEEEAITKAKV